MKQVHYCDPCNRCHLCSLGQLKRLAKRIPLGITRTGGIEEMAAVTFFWHSLLQINAFSNTEVEKIATMPNDYMNALLPLL